MTKEEREQKIKDRLAMSLLDDNTTDDRALELIGKYLDSLRKVEDLRKEIKAHRESYKVNKQ